MTLKCMLVHPKDNSTPKKQAGIVYQILYSDCDMVYTGDTGRREKEYKKDEETLTGKKFTRARRKESATVRHSSALRDHVSQTSQLE